MEISFDEIRNVDSFGVGQDIIVAMTPILTQEELEENWRHFRNRMSHEYQMGDISEFTRWNFYLFYVVEDKNKIDRNLKYKVEHDTISSRKIVVSAKEAKDGVQALINKYIKFVVEGMTPHHNVEEYKRNAELMTLYTKYENQED